MDATASRLLVALSSLVLNLGARHLPNGLSPRMQMLTSSDGMRTLVLCALFYLSTRDVMLSVALAFVFFIVTTTFLNERSRYSLLRSSVGLGMGMGMGVPLISSQVYEEAVNTVLRFRRQERSARPVPDPVRL